MLFGQTAKREHKCTVCTCQRDMPTGASGLCCQQVYTSWDYLVLDVLYPLMFC
ncbi:unnamed protein product [Tenebrio molitor]|nr:unnamed protein product [Tenebrio molitor]